jgi:hypothetical protein
MAKPNNPNQNAQNVHADLPDGAMEAQLQKFVITDDFGSVAAIAIDGSQMYTGTGNSPANYHIDANHTLGFQLDLKEHYRTGNDIAPTTVDPNGTAHFTVPAGTQHTDPDHDVGSDNANRGAWNFDYVVATGLDGATTNLSDFTFKLAITQNGTNTHIFDLNAATHAWVDEANPTVGFGGDDFHPHEGDANANVTSHVAENSVNMAFLAGAFGSLATSTAAGTTYDIKLEAFDHTHFVGMVHDFVLLA